MKVLFAGRAWEDYLHWVEADRDTLVRINTLIENARRTPFDGIGKPEPLRNEMAGWWLRRIGREHRLVYRVSGAGAEQVIEIAACRFHYGR